METSNNEGYSFNKWLITLIISLAIGFTGVVLYLQYIGVGEPSTLIVSVFAFLTGELWHMASIKKKKIEAEEKTLEDFYEEYETDESIK